MSQQISLNTDIGEGFGAWSVVDDETLLQFVTDANLACGAHGGDPDIMRRTCDIAAARGITVGAQVGYFDLRGFGRRYIDVPPDSLVNDLLYQLGALSAFTAAAGIPIGYVKVHGALYHATVARPDYAHALITACRTFDPALPVLAQPDTALYRAVVDGGMTVIAEGYIDRAYQADGLLVPRGAPGAVISDVDECVARAVQIARTGTVSSIDGGTVEVPARSICLHSDSPGAITIARAVRAALDDAGVAVGALP